MADQVGIITGLAWEAAIIVSEAHRRGVPTPLIAVAILGDPNLTFRHTARLIADGAQGLVSFGIAGGLDPALKAGDLVLPHEVQDGERRFACDPAWRAALQAHSGNAVSWGALVMANSPVASVEQKTALRTKSGAVAVDMESGIVARAAAERKLPFVCVRAIADPSSQTLPQAALVALSAKGEVQIGAVLSELWKQPLDAVHLARLGYQSALARRTLAGLCHKAGPGLGFVSR